MQLEVRMMKEDGKCQTHRLASPVLVGRDKSCGIVLRNWRVARRHARLYIQGDGVAIEDLGSLAGTLVNGRRIGQQGALTLEDDIVIGGYLLQVRRVESGVAAIEPSDEGETRLPALAVPGGPPPERRPCGD